MSLYTPLPRVRSISMFKAGVPGRKVIGRKAQFIFCVTSLGDYNIFSAVEGERRDHFNFVFVIFLPRMVEEEILLLLLLFLL